MCALVHLILQNDDTETDETGGEQYGGTGEGDKTNFPREYKPNDGPGDETSDGLNDGTEGDTGETVDLLRIVA